VPDRSAKDAFIKPSVQTANENALVVVLESRLDSLLLSTDDAAPIFPQPT
jgi:hypothetical protein